MSLAGEGAVAIWHDIAPEGREEFYSWHGREHMPERVSIPGFLRGRRYVGKDAELEFFNLYEADTAETLTGREYKARVDNPTPWTLSTVRHFRNVARSICRVAGSFGYGGGGLAATWRYDVGDDDTELHIAELTRIILPGIADRPSIAGAHLLVANEEASSVGNSESEARGEPNKVPRWIVIVEGWGDEADFAETCRTALSDEVLSAAGAQTPTKLDFYRLQATCSDPELPHPGWHG